MKIRIKSRQTGAEELFYQKVCRFLVAGKAIVVTGPDINSANILLNKLMSDGIYAQYEQMYFTPNPNPVYDVDGEYLGMQHFEPKLTGFTFKLLNNGNRT